MGRVTQLILLVNKVDAYIGDNADFDYSYINNCHHSSMLHLGKVKFVINTAVFTASVQAVK
ncbi:Hypothetical predicted protein, partial [Paramuricea clavata]